MKLPLAPPAWHELLDQPPDWLGRVLALRIGPEVKGRYEHWDRLRHLTPPDGLEPTEWWAAIKLARMAIARPLPFLDKQRQPFTVALTDSIQRKLFFVARDAAGALRGADQPQPDANREQFLFRSLMEEAMTSSQLEGAATTTQVAKDMLRSGRAPRDYGERMIVNNFATMRELRHWAGQPLTPETVFEIHRMLTDGTLGDPGSAGRFRRHDENIVVEDEIGTLLHMPPDAAELPARMRTLCDFANQRDDDTDFVHPVVRAILIHFMIGYDHPFVDGNGRTARALFYWSMLKSGFWMAEYISISSILRQAPAQYTRAYLHTESDAGDATYFLAHQLDVLLKAIEGVHAYITRKQQARREAENLLSPQSLLSRRLNHRQRALLLNALKHPGKPFNIAEHQRAHGVVYQTARSDLLGLVDAGLMRQERDGRQHVFLATGNLGKRLQVQDA
ncbi:Fic family protein [Lysobacter pythonis]|uniref:Fic family protein n=1 Tax=Solilutibacter pythonis TaxID=2483112 RepID=A0A3M2HV19_9GAMM|nr:Fic family protein [Lysobacter pythonis]RMH92868.1 Fic family protein [Lysobacter pythonis]